MCYNSFSTPLVQISVYNLLSFFATTSLNFKLQDYHDIKSLAASNIPCACNLLVFNHLAIVLLKVN